ncbi:MAG: 6-pyruvoyl-tetrahydropterin synthase-related protein [Acidimicrobiales bacterium]
MSGDHKAGSPAEEPAARASGNPTADSRSVYPYLVAGALYLAVSVIIWAHVWTGHPTAMTTCGCGDSSSSIWFTFWPAYAISHGHDPLFSTAVGYPTGISLIFASFGIALAPLTWLVGSVAALNVGLTAVPVLSALSMFALVRRWVSWMPAAFVAGLFYGFSPFVLNNLASAHVDFTFVAVPPLVVICLDELLIRQRRSPKLTGIVLGLLLSLQFLVGVEVLILMLIEVVIGVILVVIDVARRDPVALRKHARPASVGAVSAAVTTCLVLAYPVWSALAGPAHYSGTIHPGLRLSIFGGTAQKFFLPSKPLVHGAFSSPFFRIVGGYQGPVLSAQYFGIGVVVVCLAGILLWRRQRLLWLFGLLSIVSLCLVTSSGPWLGSLPVLKNIVPLHFVLFAYLAVAVLLGVIVDNTRSAVNDISGRSVGRSSRTKSEKWRSSLRRWPGAASGLVVASLAIAPPAVYVAQGIPFTIEPIILPTWFRTVAPHLSGHPVVLVLPAPFTATKGGLKWTDSSGRNYSLSLSGKQAAMTWQALSGQRFSMVGSGGLGAGTVRNDVENAGQNVISQVTFAYATHPVITSSDLVAVHRALLGWKVTTVVLPDQPELPEYDQVASVPAMAAMITGATGLRPTHTAKAWVWNGVDHSTLSTYPTAAQYASCTNGTSGIGGLTVDRTVACVLAASHASRIAG